MARLFAIALLLFCLGCAGWSAEKGARSEAGLVEERVHFRLGKEYFREHQAEAVIRRYQELLAANADDVATLNNLAWSLATAADVTVRDTKRAIQLAQKAVNLSQGKEPAPLDTLGHCYFYDGQLDRAIETEEQAVALAPTSRPYQRALGSFRQAKAERGAQDRLRRFTGEGSAVAVELVAAPEPEPGPEVPLPAEAQAHLEEAKRLLRQKAWAQARAELEQVVALTPGYAPAYNYLGAVAARLGDPAEAIRSYEQAIQYDPQLAAAWNNLAWLLATAEEEVFRDPLRAVASALKAVELTNAKEPDMLDTLAEAYFAAGRLQDAVEVEQKALALGTGDTEHYRRQLARFLAAGDESSR